MGECCMGMGWGQGWGDGWWVDVVVWLGCGACACGCAWGDERWGMGGEEFQGEGGGGGQGWPARDEVGRRERMRLCEMEAMGSDRQCA